MSLVRRAISSLPLPSSHVTQQRQWRLLYLVKPGLENRTFIRHPFSTAAWRLQQQYQYPENQPQTVHHNYGQQSATQQSLYSRSRSFRILVGTLKYALLAAVFTVSGAAISLYWQSRQRPDIQAVISPQKTPTNAETLTLYQPPDATSAEVDANIRNHPIAISLREKDEFTESRPHMKMPKGLRPTNLTGGTLSGPGRIVVPPLMFNEQGGKSMVGIFYLGEQLCGHPGIIHGGLLATLLDEGLARCCFPALPNKVAVTANLKIDYRKPAKADGYFVLRAETTKVEGRKAWVKGWIERLGEEGEEPVKCVEAEALYIEPRNVAVMKKLYNLEDEEQDKK